MWCEKIFWCFIGHFLVFSWITSLAHGSALKGSEPLYLHVGSSDADSEMGYLKNMKDDGKKGYEHFESFHNKDGDDYGYEKHEAFGYEDSKDSKDNKDSKDEETKADLKDNPIVVQDAEEENQVEDYKEEKKEEPESENHQETEEHQDIKVEPVSEVQPEEEHKDDQEHHDDPEEEEELTKIDRSDDHVEEVTEENPVGVQDHQELKKEEPIKEQDPEKTTEEPPKDDYSEDYQSEEDYTDEDKKKTTRNANQDEEEIHEIYVSEPEDAPSTKKTYEVTESAEIVEGDQTQQLRYPYGFYDHYTNAVNVNPYYTTEATPRSALNTRVNYGFYSPVSGLQKPQPTRPLAPTFSPRLSPLVKPRKNLGAFGYETMIYHHPGSSPNRQAIQIKIYDGEITVPATNVKAEEEESPKNAVDYDDEESEEEEDSAEVEDEKRQNLRQEDYDSEEDSGSSEESVERKPSGKYQNEQSDDSSSGEEEDSDDLQSQLVTTSDVDNDAYYWL